MDEPVVKRTKENLARYYDVCEECLKEHRKTHKLPSDYSCSCAWSIDNEMCPDIEQKYQKFKEVSKMGKILRRLERVKDGFKFLKSYVMHYEVDGEPYQYELVSRNDLQDPSQLGQSTNAIAIVPIFRNMEILVCREFRYAISNSNDIAILISFWNGTSKGTKHMIDISNDKGIIVKVMKVGD